MTENINECYRDISTTIQLANTLHAEVRLHPYAHGQSEAGVRPSPRGVRGQPENIGLFSTTSL